MLTNKRSTVKSIQHNLLVTKKQSLSSPKDDSQSKLTNHKREQQKPELLFKEQKLIGQ